MTEIAEPAVTPPQGSAGTVPSADSATVGPRAVSAAPLAALLPLTGLVIAIYWDTLQQLAAIWDKDPSYSHGWLVPLAAVGFAVLAYRRGRPDLAPAMTGQGVSSGASTIVLGLILHAAAWMMSVLLLDVVSLIVVVRGLLMLVGGPAMKQTFGFAALFLIFMAPLPPPVYQSAALAMQHFVSVISTACLETLGIAAYRQGYIVHLADYTMEVGEACSGLRGITAVLALAVAIGEVYQNGKPVRWLLVLLAPPVAVASNCLRVTLSGVIMVLFGRKWAEGVFHTMEGLATILIAAVALLAIAWGLSQLEEQRKARALRASGE